MARCLRCHERVHWSTNLKQRVFDFAVALLRIYPRIAKLDPAKAHIALQLVEASSSVGAQLEEGDVALSRRDMAAKQVIALREAKESRYWLRLLIAVGVLVDELSPLRDESEELVAMLTASVRKLKGPSQSDF